MTRVNAIIFYPRAAPGSGLLTESFDTIRGRNTDRQAIGFRQAGADVSIVEGGDDEVSFGRRVRELAVASQPDRLILL